MLVIGCMDGLLDLDNLKVPDIMCIAHHMSRINRWCGGTVWPVSLTQHSLLVCRILGEGHVGHLGDEANRIRLLRDALMHDSHEILVQDVPSPLKVILPDYVELERRVGRSFAERYGIDCPLPSIVKLADQVAACVEARDFGATHVPTREVAVLAQGVSEEVPMLPNASKRAFLQAFDALFPEYAGAA